jgi:hypothetical protein
MKKYLFESASIKLIVKAPNSFMATCYANQYMESRWKRRWETHEAKELENDMDFGVILAITGNTEWFDSKNKYYLKEL